MAQSIVQILESSIAGYCPSKLTNTVLETKAQYDGVEFELLTDSVKLYILDSRGKRTWRSVDKVHSNFNQKIDQKYQELVLARQADNELLAKEEQIRTVFNQKLNNVQNQLKNNSKLTLKKGFEVNTFSVNIIDITDAQVLSIAKLLNEIKQ